jgi:arsenate reductase-like glutaredoxin family protein
MSCSRVSRFLDAHGIKVRETVPASRKLGKPEAVALARSASEIFVAKGKKLERFEGGKSSENVVSRMLGPTGNLRSPALRIGKVVVVGFNEEALARVLLRPRSSTS